LVPHFDNITPHRSAAAENWIEIYQFRHDPQHFYSMQISLCDGSLSGNLKIKLNDEEFQTLEQLQVKVEHLLGQVTSSFFLSSIRDPD
jgi:hypothetical protein